MRLSHPSGAFDMLLTDLLGGSLAGLVGLDPTSPASWCRGWESNGELIGFGV